MSKSVRRVLLAGILAFVLYPLSYAPLCRATRGTFKIPFGAAPVWQVAYRPVLALIDRTPLSGPLIWWSDLWGVGDRHRLESRIRSIPLRPIEEEPLLGEQDSVTSAEETKK